MKFVSKALLTVSGFGLAGAAVYLWYLNRNPQEDADSTPTTDPVAENPIIGPTEPSFECPICYEDRCVACVPQCGHAMCSSCVRDVLTKGVNDKCGFCREPLSHDQREYATNFRVPPANPTAEDLSFALHAAVRENNYDFVRYYLKAGADVNSDPYGVAPCLFLAVAQDQFDMVNLLIDHGAELSCTDFHGRTLLHAAARAGSRRMLEKLVQAGLPLDVKISSGEAPIHAAVSSGSLDAVKFLVDAGSDLNAKVQGNVTTLVIAASKDCPQVLKFLLENGARIIPELNAVELAARSSLECLKVFAEAGVSLEVESGPSPLMSACSRRRMDTTKFLLSQGVDPNYSHQSGDSAVMVAAYGNWIEGLKVLQAHGANLDVTNVSGANTVNVASLSRSFDALKYLVEQGCDVNGKYRTRLGVQNVRTSLRDMLALDQYELAEMLLQAGADPNVNLGTVYPETVLFGSVFSRKPEAIRLLLKYGATVDHVDSHGFQAIQYAKRIGDSEIVEILKEAGADADLPAAPGVDPGVFAPIQQQQQQQTGLAG